MVKKSEQKDERMHFACKFYKKFNTTASRVQRQKVQLLQNAQKRGRGLNPSSAQPARLTLLDSHHLDVFRRKTMTMTKKKEIAQLQKYLKGLQKGQLPGRGVEIGFRSVRFGLVWYMGSVGGVVP